MMNFRRRLFIPGTVIALFSAVAGAAATGAETTTFRSSVPEIRSLWHLVRSTLSQNHVTFAGKTGPVAAFSAGSLYPQIWIRDAATIIPAARYYYPAADLVSGLEEHLFRQKSDGGLADWIDGRGQSDKNTTETDQEASAVLAAAQAVEILGPGWLDKKVNGRTVIDRLDRALTFVLEQRFDPGRGLVKGAHTADWGDVGLEDADQTAIYVDRDTHWTADIYDQSMFHAAARALAGLFKNKGRTERADFWTRRAEVVREAADRLLWQENRGFYRVHVHLDSLVHPFDEDDMFALGGNTEAIVSGLAGPEKAGRIIRAALSRQAAFRMPTIGATLLPPYPKGTFKHPMVDDPFEYQNGGLWDWFAGKLIREMFARGFSTTARVKLLEIARKNIAGGGLHEWDAPDGSGRGSAVFAGSAGSLASAVAEGYFGIRLTRDTCNLEPRLAEDGAKVYCRLPAAGVSAAYDYAWDSGRNRVTFRYESTVSRPGRIRLLLPRALSAAKLDVRRDGRPVPFTVERLEEDTLLTTETDFAPHALVIRAKNSRGGQSRP
ncbi:MAG: hypothetical protein NTW38_07140 [Candidatus Aminicenantes bacterium]|nr:hypothetical protein [Candidatus Aminicenantes bacterium]